MIHVVMVALAILCFVLDLVDFKLGTFGKWITVGLIFIALALVF